jgi:hypothetical protein
MTDNQKAPNRFLKKVRFTESCWLWPVSAREIRRGDSMSEKHKLTQLDKPAARSQPRNKRKA